MKPSQAAARLAALVLLGAPVAAAAGAPAPADIAKGKALYDQICSTCHGVAMVNPGTSSFDLRVFPHDEKPRFVNSVTHGKNAMPAWGDILKPEEIDLLWDYISTHGKQ